LQATFVAQQPRKRKYKMKALKKYFSVLLILTLMFLPAYSHAAEPLTTDWQTSLDNEGSQRLIVGEYNTEKSEISAAMQLNLTKNWHTYWKNPGDSGMAHKIDFSKSENIKDLQIIWPAPKRDVTYGVESFVYGGQNALPLKITVLDNTKPTKINLSVKWAICDEICIFEEDNFELKVSPSEANPENQKIIAEALAKVPNSAEAQAYKISGLKHLSDNILQVEVTSTENISETADVFLNEESKNFRFPKPELKIAADKKSAIFTFKYEVQVSTAKLAGTKLEVYFVDNNKSVSQTFDVTTVGAESAPANTTPSNTNNQPQPTIIYAILAALLGGLILNIMPCVLPVLSIKIMSVIKLGGADKKTIRTSFLFTILGIITSFMVLAFGIILLRQAGQVVGWGSQFQHPAFIMLLVFILTIFTANLLGFFEFNLSSKLSDKLHLTLDKTHQVSKVGSFLTGAFATLLATPCTAPFLGTAITFALSQSALQILYIFFFMGVGLALPYILVFISPALVKIFPKPGAWMANIKKIMALFLIVTILWLVFVMNGLVNLLAASITFVTFLVFLWLVWYVHRKNIPKSRFAMATIYIFIISLIAPIYFFQPMTKKLTAQEYWQVFDEQKIPEHIAKNEVVFVDVTADWCLTCQFNKKRVIYPMLNYLIENKVVGMKADFTQPSLEIQKYLESYKAYGIPFNVVYGPAEPKGVVLPVVLTEENVKAAIKKAKGE
jgi:suppressor for copper-sensitivity B